MNGGGGGGGSGTGINSDSLPAYGLSSTLLKLLDFSGIGGLLALRGWSYGCDCDRAILVLVLPAYALEAGGGGGGGGGGGTVRNLLDLPFLEENRL